MSVYLNREEAGEKLAELYRAPPGEVVVLGIPRGGVPVGLPIARKAGGALDVIVVRKLPIPWSPEAGFGAIAPDGNLSLNEEMMSHVKLSDDEIRAIAVKVLDEVHRRERAYRGDRPFPELAGRHVVLTDDGLATGFTMIAAIKMARAKRPELITVAVPVSPADSARRVGPMADSFICPLVTESYPFAVASFYEDFHDMTDGEVRGYLAAAVSISRKAAR